MFRKPRRIKKEISIDAAKQLLKENRRAALSVNGDNGYPYSVPINFYYEEEENAIYFHSSKVGHKIDSIKTDDKVCLTTWDDGTLEDGDWAYFVSSCIVFGRAKLIQDTDLALEKIQRLAAKYYPTQKEIDEEIRKDFHAVQMVCIEIEHISGKRIQEK